MLLNVSAILPGRPIHEPGRRMEKSPSCIFCREDRMTVRSAAGASTTPTAPAEWPLLSIGFFAAAAAVDELELLFFIGFFSFSVERHTHSVWRDARRS